MKRQRGAGLEARQQHAALSLLILPNPLLADSRAGLDPLQLTQRKDLRGWRSAHLQSRLNTAGDDCQHRGPLLTRYGMDAAVRPVAHIPGRHGSEIIREGTLNDEDQLIAGVPMKRKPGARPDASHKGPSLRLRMLPEVFHAYPGLQLLPLEVADRDHARS